jgi:hypothetical protein
LIGVKGLLSVVQNDKKGKRKKFESKISFRKPEPASAVEELRTTEREDPGFSPDEGS